MLTPSTQMLIFSVYISHFDVFLQFEIEYHYIFPFLNQYQWEYFIIKSREVHYALRVKPFVSGCIHCISPFLHVYHFKYPDSVVHKNLWLDRGSIGYIISSERRLKQGSYSILYSSSLRVRVQSLTPHVPPRSISVSLNL